MRGVNLYPWLRFYVGVMRFFNGLSLVGLVALMLAVAYGAVKLPPEWAIIGTVWVLLAIAVPWLWSIAIIGVIHETAGAIADLAENGAMVAHDTHRIQRGLAAGSSHVV
jgi:hypothetical protein